jgi:hypothetical protein
MFEVAMGVFQNIGHGLLNFTGELADLIETW